MSHVTKLENNMNHRKGKKDLSNAVLAKYQGINHILNPEAVKLGGYNVYHVFFGVLVLYVSLISVVSCFNGLFYWKNHRAAAMLHIGMAEFTMFTCYKMLILIHRWREIRDCLTITRIDFTTYCHSKGANLLQLWRSRIFLITSIYAVTFLIPTILNVLGPLMFNHGVRTMKSPDGSQSDYRISVLNLYAMFSAKTYNTHFHMIYFIESMYLCLFLFFLVMFDTLFITLCMALSCQLEIINIAFESSGPKKLIEDSVQIQNDDKIGSMIFSSTFEHFLAYNELKAIITDHQSIIKKLEHFFSIFQFVMLLQIISSAFLIIAMLLNLGTVLAEGEIDEDTKSTIVKMIFASPLPLIELFLTCYSLESLHKQKESIIFALYSSNWTKMDLKCRNLILLTMRVNNAHKRKFKFSQLRIVNLEMFFATMRICYSILSVMLNRKTN